MPEIVEQPRRRDEGVSDLPVSDMLVVAFAGLIVEAHDAYFSDDKGQPIFETDAGYQAPPAAIAGSRARQTHSRGAHAVRETAAAACVGKYANTCRRSIFGPVP
jgi:hypothetical protein